MRRAAKNEEAIPTSGEISLFIIVFLWYLLLYLTIYSLCVAAAPHLDNSIPRITITFDNDNDVIVYALEKIISFARNNHYIFLALSIWWISSLIGLQQGLAIHIDNLRERSEIILREAVPLASNTICHIDTNHCKRTVSVMPRDIQ